MFHPLQINEELLPNPLNLHGKELEDDFLHKEEKKREKRMENIQGRGREDEDIIFDIIFRVEFLRSSTHLPIPLIV